MVKPYRAYRDDSLSKPRDLYKWRGIQRWENNIKIDVLHTAKACEVRSMQHRTGNIGRLLSTREGNFCFHIRGWGDCLTISFSGTVHHAAHYVRCTRSDLGGCLCAASKYSSVFSCKNWWEQQNTAIGTADAPAKTRNMRPTSRKRGIFEGVKTACTACCITSWIYDGLWTISIAVFLDVRLGTSMLYTYDWGSRSLRNVDQYLPG